jgi:hypothetical protein
MLKDFIQKSLFKPWDFVIVFLLILFSFAPIVVYSIQQQGASPEKEAVLRVDGQEIKTFSLKAGQKSYTYEYKDAHGDYNLIEVSGDKIRISEADCSDQVCVRRGWAEDNGETIVCLPHKLVIEVRSADGSEGDQLIY